MAQDDDARFHAALWGALAVLLAWSGFAPKDRFTWFLEVVPVFIGTAILLAVYRKFTFSRLVCWLLFLHSIVLLVGGHWTYAEVPLGNWVRDALGRSRNDYDRLGHFMQGFVPALVTREVLLRRGVVKKGPWLTFLSVCVCLAVSATYELFEWQSAVWAGAKSDAFLGSQGDPWDTQEDMAMAFVGAVTALLTLPRVHDASIARKS